MDTFVLKLIALLIMTIDHAGAIFSNGHNFYLRIIGRVSFPLFAFCVGTGLIHTRNVKKYIFRMTIFALISQIPFAVFMNIVNYGPGYISIFSRNLNVMFTFLASAICVFIYQLTFLNNNENSPLKKAVGVLSILAVLVLCEPNILSKPLLNIYCPFVTDYGFFGAALPFIIYLLKDKPKQIIAIIIIILFIYPPINLLMIQLNLLMIQLVLSAYVSLIFIFFYNEKKGLSSKYLFYLYYPLHILVLCLIRIFNL